MKVRRMFLIDEVFKKSLVRVMKHKIDGMDFLEYFYQIFLESSPEVFELFKNVSMKLQKEMLRKSIYELLVFYSEKKVNQHLLAIGQLHSKDYLGITPKFYDLWLEVLMKALKEFDPEYTHQIELTWRVTLSPGIAYMKFSYDHAISFEVY